MSNRLSRDQLWSLEDYAEHRDTFRREVIAHKKNRQFGLGEHMRFLFEDRKTIHYQIQEMLRAERIYEAESIEEELEAYNPLIPDGDNWKVTLMLEYPDEEEREQQLRALLEVENKVWVKIGDFDKVYAIADEDMERSTEEKTSSVHFLRFQLTAGMVASAHQDEPISIGCDHEQYPYQLELDGGQRHAIVADLDNLAVH